VLLTLLVTASSLQLQENLKTETHVSETAFRSLKLEEDEFKSKLLQSEGIISTFKKQLEENDEDQLSNNKKYAQLHNTIKSLTDTMEPLNRTAQLVCEKQKQLQATIDILTNICETNNQTVQELREKEKQLQATIDGQIKTEEANTRTVQDLLEKQNQLQATIDGLTKKAEALNQEVQLLCGQTKDVSTYKLEAVTNSKGLKYLRQRI
jgi:chromosome segregation ATPase